MVERRHSWCPNRHEERGNRLTPVAKVGHTLSHEVAAGERVEVRHARSLLSSRSYERGRAVKAPAPYNHLRIRA